MRNSGWAACVLLHFSPRRVSLETLQPRRFGRSVLRVNLRWGTKAVHSLSANHAAAFLEPLVSQTGPNENALYKKINKKQARGTAAEPVAHIFSGEEPDWERAGGSRLTRHAGHLLLFSLTCPSRFVLVRAANFSIRRAINNRLARARIFKLWIYLRWPYVADALRAHPGGRDVVPLVSSSSSTRLLNLLYSRSWFCKKTHLFQSQRMNYTRQMCFSLFATWSSTNRF